MIAVSSPVALLKDLKGIAHIIPKQDVEGNYHFILSLPRTDLEQNRPRNSITHAWALYRSSSAMIDGRGTHRVYTAVLGAWESFAASLAFICTDLGPSVANPRLMYCKKCLREVWFHLDI